MPYCSNCGHKINDSAKFCEICGNAILKEKINSNRERVFEGEIHKCPNCGEVLNSFIEKCPSCDYEIRGAANSDAIKEFANKLVLANSQQEKINIIRNFPIPNTKEDILEFMILASTNVDEELEKEISASWKSKTEQAYEKAQILFQDEKDFLRIQSIYLKMCKKLEIQKRNEKFKNMGNIIVELIPIVPNVIFVLGWLISLFVLIPLCKINLDDVGTNGYQVLLVLDMIVGVIFIPFTFKCSSSLPKLITSMGLILSIVVLIPHCGKNLDDVGTNAFQLIMFIDIICSSIIFGRMFKKKYKSKVKKSDTNGTTFFISLICVAIMFFVYEIGNVKTSIVIKKEEVAREKEKQKVQSVTYKWPSKGLSKYLPLPLTEYGKIETDDETRFNIKLFQVDDEDFENYVEKCKKKGFTIDTTNTDSVFYAYNKEKYKLDIFYWEDEDSMEIFVDAPEEMIKFEWPTSKIAKKLPIPKTLIGHVWSDTSEDFGVNMADVSQKEFLKYIDACKKKGFKVNYVKEENYYKAYNKYGDEVTLHLQTFDVMQIYIETPENE